MPAIEPSPQPDLFRLHLSGSRLLDGLLVLGVAAIVVARVWPREALWVFVLAAGGLIPLAAVLGEATVDLAGRTGPLAAGLLQSTLGNASELILGITALRAGLLDVVKASLVGSIISNLLLVLGLAMLFGGWGRRRQTVDREVASSNTTMLFLASVGLIVPAVFSLGVFGRLGAASPAIESLSLWTALILIVIYVVSVVYQLRAAAPVVPRGAVVAAGRTRPVMIMLASVVWIAALSELLVGELHTAQAAFHGTDLFWGGVVFALIGNAAEHGVAVTAARRNDMDLAMAIGVGSSLQIALLLAPVLVFLSLALGHPMSLVFTGIEVAAVVLSTVMVGMIAADGETNWLEGAELLAVYAILVIGFYFVPV